MSARCRYPAQTVFCLHAFRMHANLFCLLPLIFRIVEFASEKPTLGQMAESKILEYVRFAKSTAIQ
jgi:hypothetical protein